MTKNDTYLRPRILLSILGLSLIPLAWVPTAQAQEEGEKKKVNKGTDIIGYIANQRRKADMTQAISNAKQLFYLLIEFDQDWGEFPNDDTAKEDEDLKSFTGKYSNDYLGQFIGGGYTRSEEIFFAKGGSTTDKKPDNDTTTRKKTLEAGECGFAYYKGMSTSDHSGRPVLCAPMTGKGFKFDPKPYNGKAIVLRIDGAVKIYTIDENGDAVSATGKKIFEGGKDSVWGEKGPDIKNLVFAK